MRQERPIAVEGSIKAEVRSEKVEKGRGSILEPFQDFETNFVEEKIGSHHA